MNRINILQICFLIVSTFVCFNNGIELPAYIKACSRADPKKLNECAKVNGQAAIASLVKGDPTYKIPVLDPLKIDNVKIEQDNSINVDLNKITVTGLKATTIKDVNFDLNKKRLEVTLHVPKLRIQGDYGIDGKILILPIKGSGPADVKALDGTYSVRFDYDLYDKDGKKYIKLGDSSVKIEPKGAEIQLDNLFNGDPKLGPDANKFLNENWRAALEVLGPAIEKAVLEVATAILSQIIEKVEYEHIFVN